MTPLVKSELYDPFVPLEGTSPLQLSAKSSELAKRVIHAATLPLSSASICTFLTSPTESNPPLAAITASFTPDRGGESSFPGESLLIRSFCSNKLFEPHLLSTIKEFDPIRLLRLFLSLHPRDKIDRRLEIEEI